MADVSKLQAMFDRLGVKASFAGQQSALEALRAHSRVTDQITRDMASVQASIERAMVPDLKHVVAEIERVKTITAQQTADSAALLLKMESAGLDMAAALKVRPPEDFLPVTVAPAEVTITPDHVAAVGDEDLVLLGQLVLGELLKRNLLFPPGTN